MQSFHENETAVSITFFFFFYLLLDLLTRYQPVMSVMYMIVAISGECIPLTNPLFMVQGPDCLYPPFPSSLPHRGLIA